MPRFQKGQSGNPNGKPKGAQSRFTKIKQEFYKVFDVIGGSDELAKWVKRSPKNQEAFYKMITQLLPKDANVNIDANFTADDRAVQAASVFFANALEQGSESSLDSEPRSLPH